MKRLLWSNRRRCWRLLWTTSGNAWISLREKPKSSLGEVDKTKATIAMELWNQARCLFYDGVITNRGDV
jgi:hypothetical protein